MTGFADKLGALLASSNPVAGPHFAFTVPEPIGVFAVLAPQQLPLLGLVTAILPLVCAGNTVVAVGSDLDPRTVITFCEALATSDFPGGVINVLTGRANELAPCATWPASPTGTPQAIVAAGAPPILVIGNTGDPAMTISVPTEQYRKAYSFHAPTNYESNFVNITAPTGANITLDGQPTAYGPYDGLSLRASRSASAKK